MPGDRDTGFYAIHVVGVIVPGTVEKPNSSVIVRIIVTKNPDNNIAVHRRFHWFGTKGVDEKFRFWVASAEQARRVIKRLDEHLRTYGMKKTDDGKVLSDKWYAVIPRNIDQEIRWAAQCEGILLFSDEEKRARESTDNEISRRVKKVMGRAL